MIRKLSDDDSRIVDLLLDRGGAMTTAPALTQVFANPNPEMFEKRIDAAERVLSLLTMDPAPEPSVDLVSRTLQLIEDPEAHRHASRASQNAAQQRAQA